MSNETAHTVLGPTGITVIGLALLNSSPNKGLYLNQVQSDWIEVCLLSNYFYLLHSSPNKDDCFGKQQVFYQIRGRAQKM